MVSGCSCKMRKMTACVISAWMPSLTASCWTAGTWSPASSSASASAGSMWCVLCKCLSSEADTLPTGHLSPSLTPDISVYRRDWKLTVQKSKLFLKIIFTTHWGQRFILSYGNIGPCHTPVSSVSQVQPSFITRLWSLIAEVRLLMESATLPLENTYPLLLSLLHIFYLNYSNVWNFCSLWMKSLSTIDWHAEVHAEHWHLWRFTLIVMYILNANIWWI